MTEITKMKELKEEYLGEEIRLLDIEDRGVGIEYIFPNDQVFNLEIGSYSKKMEGYLVVEREEYEFNFTFETVGDWEVVDNSHNSSINTTVIDIRSINIKVTDIDYI